MNQQLIFNDDVCWNVERKQIECSVIHGGMKIRCSISADYLAPSAVSKTTAEWLALYDAQRFDIEDELQEMVEQEQFTEAGELVL